MAWLEFEQDWRWTPAAERRVTFKFLAGKRYGVTRECANLALAAGVAHAVSPPGRPAPAIGLEAVETPIAAKPRRKGVRRGGG